MSFAAFNLLEDFYFQVCLFPTEKAHKHPKYCFDDSHNFKQEEQNLLHSVAGNFHLFFRTFMDLHIQPVLIISSNNTKCPGHFI